MNKLIKTGGQIALNELISSQPIVMIFPKNRSALYQAAVSLARLANSYAESGSEGSIYHYAAFDLSRHQAQIALSVMRYMLDISGFQLFIRGKLVAAPSNSAKALACYLDALECADSRAHCHAVATEDHIFEGTRPENPFSLSLDSITAPVTGQNQMYIFPCRLLFNDHFKIYRQHPSTEQNQIQAGAIQRGCDFCPLFNQHDLKRL